MSYTLSKLNVVKTVDSERIRDKLLKEGFTLVEENKPVDDVPSGNDAPKPEATPKKTSSNRGSKDKSKKQKDVKSETTKEEQKDASPEVIQEGGEGDAGTSADDGNSGGSKTGS